MQITLVSSGDTVSDVWDLIPIINYIEAAFDIEFFSFCEQRSACGESIAQDLSKLSIHKLKEVTNSLSSWFVTSLLPRRNSKISLSHWISEIFLHVYTSNQVSAAEDMPMIAEKAIAVANGASDQIDGTQVSGLAISFGKTLKYLPQKSVTRRTWKDNHAEKFVAAFNQGKAVKAFDRDIRYGGKHIGWCKLLAAPYKERLVDMPQEDLAAEGGMCGTIGEFIEQYFDNNPRLEVWVIRFRFIPLLHSEVLADIAKIDQPAENLQPSEVEVLEPEEKPVYEIALLTGDGRSTKAQTTQIPPYLVHNHRLFEKSSFACAAFDAVYNQTISEHLSNIAEEYGTPVDLLTDDLVVAKYNVHGNPPPFILYQSGVYKRMTWGVISLGKIVKYSQVVSEYLSNITVV